jgi:hypothetical protein
LLHKAELDTTGGRQFNMAEWGMEERWKANTAEWGMEERR